MKRRSLIVRAVAVALSVLMCIATPIPSYASSGDIDGRILEDSKNLARQIEEEGIVLLKNDGVLPLDSEMKVNVFGYDAFSPKYGATAGSGTVKQENCISFYAALDHAGIEYNSTLYNAYKNAKNEMAPSKIDFNQAKNFSDTAIIMIGRAGMEGKDLAASDLRVTGTEASLIEAVCGNFENVIVIFDTANIMEMGWLEEYESIKAAMIIWNTGEVGMEAVGEILAGTVNPSGKLTDSIAYSVDDYPSTVNFGNFKYGNKDATFIEYEEGIYLGYRYFETFGIDVQYPFGYGLSYTEFAWTGASCSFDGRYVNTTVTVTNIGERTGKDVAQVYISLPYYEGGIEKSAIQLASYAKTGALAPGESETLNISFDIWDVSSYDQYDLQAYVLDAGEYNVYISRDVKTKVAEFSFVLPDRQVRKYDERTGVEIKNLFGEASYDGFTVLSRSNFEGTKPTAPYNQACPVDISDMDKAVAPKMPEGTVAPTFGATYDKTIYLQEVYQNPELMDKFLDQLTVDEAISLICDCGYKSPAINRLGITGTQDNDGPASVKGAGGLLFKDSGVAWPVGECLASTWNDELAYMHGVQAGIEAANIGTDVWYSPTANLHRNPMGGRNFEYYSEDPVVTGHIAKAIVEGTQSTGLTITVKHLVLNEQETNRWGALTWADEQTIRELYLRPFEDAIMDGEATGVMSAYSRLGKTWCGGNSALIKDLLRGEWGYDDFVISDFSVYGIYGGYMNPRQCVYVRNDATLTGLYAVQMLSITNQMKEEYKNHPVEFGIGMRECCEDILKMKMNSTAFKNVAIADDTFRIEGETGKVKGSPNKGSSFVEVADTASTGYTLCNCSKKNNVITWTFNAYEAGFYNMNMTLANTHLLGYDVKLSNEIKMTLNGDSVSVKGFTIKGYGPLTFNHFDNYGDIVVELQEGENVITWTVVGGDCPNVDYFDFTLIK